ncbi:MAG: hypothetical protein WCR05_09815 [Sphaerochaetaceae bacterium]|jgi:hypothetical protein
MDELTKAVVTYNRLRTTLKKPSRSKRFKALEAALVETCQESFYYLPAETKLLSQELCAEFLLSCLPYTSTIICNFVDRGIPFDGYLKKIIRTRAKTFCSQKKQQEHETDILLSCSGSETDGIICPTINPCENRQEDPCLEGCSVCYPDIEEQIRRNFYARYRELSGRTASTSDRHIVGETIPHFGSQQRTASDSMKHLFGKLSSIPNREQKKRTNASDRRSTIDEQAKAMLQKENPAALKLQANLQNPTFRKRFLILLLANPEQLSAPLINQLAIIMDIDELDLANLVSQAFEFSQRNQRRRHELQHIINRHWRRHIWLEQQLNELKSISNYDQEEVARVEMELTWTRKMLDKRRQEYERSFVGISCSQLAALLDLPKGTICSSLFYARRMLAECIETARE